MRYQNHIGYHCVAGVRLSVLSHHSAQTAFGSADRPLVPVERPAAGAFRQCAQPERAGIFVSVPDFVPGFQWDYSVLAPPYQGYLSPSRYTQNPAIGYTTGHFSRPAGRDAAPNTPPWGQGAYWQGTETPAGWICALPLQVTQLISG